MKQTKIGYIILGCIFGVLALFMNGVSISVNKFPSSLMLIAICIMCFCLSYLVQHLTAKDERAKKIRERSIYVNYFILIAVVLLLMIVFNPISNLHIEAYNLLSIMMTVYISSVFLTMVYYAKKY
ncbi:permease [Viridibacillus arvi]|uniref:permease n=1 Tax=Viridibacillus arvi TaxID=263475 RepID=UPI0036E7FC58